MKTCKGCDATFDDETIDGNDGYCDDCILETMDPAWVKEHYPDAYGDDDDEEEDDDDG